MNFSIGEWVDKTMDAIYKAGGSDDDVWEVATEILVRLKIQEKEATGDDVNGAD